MIVWVSGCTTIPGASREGVGVTGLGVGVTGLGEGVTGLGEGVTGDGDATTGEGAGTTGAGGITGVVTVSCAALLVTEPPGLDTSTV